MSPKNVFRCFVAGGCLLFILGCQDAENSDILALGQRGVAVPPSGRDAGIYGGGVPFIDTGVSTGTAGTDFTEGARCSTTNRRACAAECGVQSCLNGRWTSCRRAVETCNGYDDDCDGNADESFGIGTGCSNRQDNGCLAQGRLICDTNGNDVLCETQPMSPGIEVCDGVDNDCDGQPDEDFPEQRCCLEDYQCPPGASCTAGQCVGGNTGGGSGGGLGDRSGAAEGEACQRTLDCTFGLACSSNTCQPVCFSMSDCAAGLTCACDANTPDCFFTACIDPNTAAPPRQAAANNGAPGSGAPSGEADRRAEPVGSCNAVVELGEFGQYFDTTNGAVNELDSTCGGRTDGPEKVFSFTLGRTRQIVLDTTGSTFDTVMSVRTTCAERGTEMLCDDDGGDARTRSSRLRFQAEAGTRYFVIVQGYRPELSGDITLSFSESN